METLKNAAVVIFAALVLATSVASVYLFYRVQNTENNLNMQIQQGVRQTLKAEQTAQTGRSKSLCDALYDLATTPAAVKLHPVFVNVYVATDCEQVTGLRP